MTDYQQWEAAQRLSPASPEAYYAEKAWNAALAQVREVLRSALAAEGGDPYKALVLIDTEVNLLSTE